VLRAAENQGVARVLYCSTCGVHGNVDCPPANESAPIAPADWYQETKWQGEVVCQRFLERGLWITIVRPAAIYGPGDPERFLMLYRRAAKGRFIMIGDGSTHYHPLYVTNLIEGIRRAIETETARGKAYLLADAHSIAIKDLVTKIGGVLGTSVRFIRVPYPPVYLSALACEAVYHFLPWEPPIFRRRIDWFVQNRAFDTTLARTELAYEPSVDLDRGLTLTAAWYRDHGYL
jgi:nucleoside-diphosphate-sugar epimerase